MFTALQFGRGSQLKRQSLGSEQSALQEGRRCAANLGSSLRSLWPSR